MKILHVINSIAIGGAETFLLRLIQEQERLGHTCYLLVIDPSHNDNYFYNNWKSTSKTLFIPAYQQKNDFKLWLLYKLNGLYKRLTGNVFIDNWIKNKENFYYQELHQKIQFDIINSHLLGADFFVLQKLKDNIQAPWIITSQGCYNSYQNVEKVAALIPKMSGMTYVAEKNLDIFEKSGLPITENRALVYNGLPKPADVVFKKRGDFGLESTDFVIGQISRSIPSKGLEISILAVIKLVHSGHKDIKLILVGPENDYYVSLKEKYAQYSNIVFAGVAMNPVEFVGLFDVGILPSYFPGESCPSSIIEYLSCGKPCITTDIGEIPNMIQYNGENAGIIIKEKDNNGIPDYLYFANAIELYYNDKKRLDIDRTLAYKAFEKFTIEITVKKYQDIYQNALSKPV